MIEAVCWQNWDAVTVELPMNSIWALQQQMSRQTGAVYLCLVPRKILNYFKQIHIS